MKEVEIIAPMGITLKGGLVKLTTKQAADRVSAVTQVKKDIYEITGETQFKNGERFFYDGDLPKNLAEEVGEVKTTDSGPKDTRTKAVIIEMLEARNILHDVKGRRDNLLKLLQEAEAKAADGDLNKMTLDEIKILGGETFGVEVDDYDTRETLITKIMASQGDQN